MEEELLNDNELNIEQIKLKKEAFRQHQRSLPFGEKMQIAFSLAERDKAIRRAVLLPRTRRISK